MKTNTIMVALIIALSLPIVAIAHGQRAGNFNQWHQNNAMYGGMNNQIHMPQHFNRSAMHNNSQLRRQTMAEQYNNPGLMHRFTNQTPCRYNFTQQQPESAE